VSNQSIAEYLSAHEFFSELSEDALKFLCECASAREIKKGQILFRHGERADKFYVIRNGRISVQIPALMGPTLEIQALGQDQVLGWSWLISPYQWNFQAKAEEDSELLEFDGTRRTGAMRAGTEIRLRVVKEICGIDVGTSRCGAPKDDG